MIGLTLLLACGRSHETLRGVPLPGSPDGAICAATSAEVTPIPGGVELVEGGDCRFCPHRATARLQPEPPELDGRLEWAGGRWVYTHREEVGCGASACEHRLTAWWPQGEGWEVVSQTDGLTDDLFGYGPDFALAWSVIAARCPGLP